jgi:hypothetical protein
MAYQHKAVHGFDLLIGRFDKYSDTRRGHALGFRRTARQIERGMAASQAGKAHGKMNDSDPGKKSWQAHVGQCKRRRKGYKHADLRDLGPPPPARDPALS